MVTFLRPSVASHAAIYTARTNVVEHISHIYEEGELDERATCRNFRQVRFEGSREVSRSLPHYNRGTARLPAAVAQPQHYPTQ